MHATPVNPVALDQSVPDLHDFHELHLVTLRSLARILPGDDATIGEEASRGADPKRSVSSRCESRICAFATTGSERVPHLAGPFPNAVLERLVETRCVAPLSIPRALRLTPKGRAFFARLDADIPF